MTSQRLDRVRRAIEEIRAGKMVILVDDEDRENEGDLTMAAELVTPEAINFMATHGRGLICLAMPGERLDELDLAPMVPDNTALHGTAFTVSIDLKDHGVTTGISAHDRARTIRAAVDARSSPDDFARPGHVFPLRARPGGVLERRGQTEAAVDLAGLAGLHPAGVICEIVNDDGTMARVPDLIWFCKRHGLVMMTVADLARYRLESDYKESLWAIDGSLLCVQDIPRCGAVNDERENMPELKSSKSERPSVGRAPTGRLFILDLSGDRVLSLSPDGSDRKVIVHECRMPDGITVDVEGGHIYWTNMGVLHLNDGSIERADLDGRNRKTIVPQG